MKPLFMIILNITDKMGVQV